MRYNFETPGESSGDEGLIVVIVLTVVENTSDISHYRRTGLASPGAASLEALRGLGANREEGKVALRTRNDS